VLKLERNLYADYFVAEVNALISPCASSLYMFSHSVCFVTSNQTSLLTLSSVVKLPMSTSFETAYQ